MALPTALLKWTEGKVFATRFNYEAFKALEDWRFDDAYRELLQFGTDEETLRIVQALVALVGNVNPKFQDNATFILIDTAVKYLFRGKEA